MNSSVTALFTKPPDCLPPYRTGSGGRSVRRFPIDIFLFCRERPVTSGGSRIFQMEGHCFVTNGGAHILFSGKKCMKLKEIGLKWGEHVF